MEEFEMPKKEKPIINQNEIYNQKLFCYFLTT